MTRLPGLIGKIVSTCGLCLLVALAVILLVRVGHPGGPGPAVPAAAAPAVLPPIAAGPADVFEDVTAKAGIQFTHQFCDTRIANIIESNGAGAVIFDYDNDGLMDIYLVNSGPLAGVTHATPGTVRQPNRLYHNRGDGTFEDVTEKAGVAGAGYGVAAVAADYDNDGHTDLYVVNIGRSILYHNRGDGTFEDVTDKAGVANNGTGIGAVFVDVDGDGKLDLFVANYLTFNPNYNLYFNPDAYPGPLSYPSELNRLYRNRGDGTFEDVSARAGIQIPGHRAMSVCAFDVNGDGKPAIYVSNDATPNLLLLNDGKGHFQETGVQAGVAFNALGEAAGSMTAAIGDCNGDLIPDILVSRLGYGSLYMGSRQGTFEDRMMVSGLGALTAQFVGWGCSLLDYDNDGDLDIFIANGDAHHLVGWESLLLENTGSGKFVDAADKGGAYFRAKVRGRGSYVLDYDNDGRLDILVTTLGDRPILLHNRGAFGNHWLTLDLQGTRSNRDGFGSRITLTAAGKRQYAEARCPAAFLGQSDRRVHFGLGASRRADRIEIHWPSGTTQVLQDVAGDRILRVKEP
ncbi:MAG: VCBS repeat-containing protein [Verrucomicrobia bacterium]|nr:VCBS repeat-containing protein [Verrucomicrobiota bacterium]